MRKVSLSFFTAIIVLFYGPLFTLAATIQYSYTDNWSLSSETWQDVSNPSVWTYSTPFDYFDSTLGTLTSVYIEYNYFIYPSSITGFWEVGFQLLNELGEQLHIDHNTSPYLRMRVLRDQHKQYLINWIDFTPVRQDCSEPALVVRPVDEKGGKKQDI